MKKKNAWLKVACLPIMVFVLMFRIVFVVPVKAIAKANRKG